MDKKCSNCGQPIPEESSFCLHCFTIINKRTDETLVHTNKKTGKNKKLIIVVVTLIILACVFSLVLIAFLNNVTHEKSENDALSAASNSSITTEHKTTQVPTTKKVITTTSPISTTTATTTETTTHAATETTTEKTTKEKTSKMQKDTTVKATTSAPQVVIDGGTLMNYPADKKNSSYTIPYKVSKISNKAFNNNKYIKTLVFSKRETVACDWANLFSNLPNLETVYVYPGTSADLEGLQYFHGEIIYFD